MLHILSVYALLNSGLDQVRFHYCILVGQGASKLFCFTGIALCEKHFKWQNSQLGSEVFALNWHLFCSCSCFFGNTGRMEFNFHFFLIDAIIWVKSTVHLWRWKWRQQGCFKQLKTSLLFFPPDENNCSNLHASN